MSSTDRSYQKIVAREACETLANIAANPYADDGDRVFAAEAITDIFKANYARRTATFIAMGTRFVALVIAVLATCSCAKTLPGMSPQTRGPDMRAALAVRIETMCVDGDVFSPVGSTLRLFGKYGSGTLINDHEILTAAHVATCEHGDPLMHAVMVDGKRFAIVVAAIDTEADVARLRTPIKIADVAPAVFGPVKVGQVICSYTAYPLPPQRYCGHVQSLEDLATGNIQHDAPTYSGNSGSAMYDNAGRIVGVVVQKRFCSLMDAWLDQMQPGSGKTCGGNATSMNHARKVLP